jgi:hypothetical protein
MREDFHPAPFLATGIDQLADAEIAERTQPHMLISSTQMAAVTLKLNERRINPPGAHIRPYVHSYVVLPWTGRSERNLSGTTGQLRTCIRQICPSGQPNQHRKAIGRHLVHRRPPVPYRLTIEMFRL